MVDLLTCKYKEDPIKNVKARVLTRLNINFLDTQGQPRNPVEFRTHPRFYGCPCNLQE